MGFQYICNSQVVESGERWYKVRFSGGVKACSCRYEHTIDAKGRISIPSKFREVLSRNTMTGLSSPISNHCLVAFPYEEWSLLEQKVGTFSLMKKETSAFFRFFYSSAMDCDIDKQGRLSFLRPCEIMRSSKGCRTGWRREADRDLRQRALVGGGRKIEDNFDQIRDTLGNVI